MKFRNVLLIPALGLAVLPSAAQSVRLPDTKPGQLAAQWLQFCKAPTQEAAIKWAKEHYTERVLNRLGPDEIAKHEINDCTAMGGYRPMEIKDSSPQKLTLLVSASKVPVWANLTFELNPEGKLGLLFPMPATPAESALPKNLSDSAIQSDLQKYADELNKLNMFSGIAMIAKDTKTIATATAGFADREKKSPITPSSQFTIGSMGKMFTAVAVGQLVDQGKLSFDDTVGKFFPKYGNKTIRDKVTVGMLLSHTGGLGDFLRKRTPEMMKNGVKRADEFVPLFENDEPQFEPGKGWAYSNAGLALAGAIVERVSGENYPDYIRKHVFEAAGMKNSDPNNVPRITPSLVTPYSYMGPNGPSEKMQIAERDIGSPAGGAISTAEDLVKFADALRTGKLVSKATFEKMATSHGQSPFGDYGYAMEIENIYGRKVVGHGGGFPGVNTHLYLVMDSPYTAVILANQDPPAADMTGQRVVAFAVEKAKQGK